MSRAKYIGAGVGCLILPVAVVIVLFIAVFDPFQFKTTVLKHPLPKGGKLSLAYHWDGDISDDYFVRIRGADSRYEDWVDVGWRVVGPHDDESFEVFASKDGRFVCVARTSWDGNFYSLSDSQDFELIIYDSKEDVLWPTEASEKFHFQFWRAALAAAVEDNREVVVEEQEGKS